MKVTINTASLSCDPADARRHRHTGTSGVKSATGHVYVVQQAARGDYMPAKTTPHSKQSVTHPSLIGTWNVRGLNEDGKLQIVEDEAARKNVPLLGLSETHWRGAGHFKTDSGNTVYFSGPENSSSNGVAFVVTPKLNKCVVGYNPVNDRIISLKLLTTPCKLNVIQVYAPTSQSSEEAIEEFYTSLTTTIKQIPSREIVMVIGDLNAKIGETKDDPYLHRLVGNYGVGERNERGDRLLQFCAEEDFTIMNTWFKHHIRRLYTWISPGDRNRNQIDYVMIQTRWRSSVLNVTTHPGADCGSDHQLLAATIRIRLKQMRKTKPPPNLKNVHLEGFRGDMEKKLQSLSPHETADSNASWMRLKMAIVQAAMDNALPSCSATMKKHFSPETAEVILERRLLKERGIKSAEDRKQYSSLSKEVQRLCRKDKTSFIDRICSDLERHAEKHETRDLFRKVRDLTRKKIPRTCAVEDEQGQLLSEMAEVLERWKQYCANLYDINDGIENTEIRITEQEPDILRSEVAHAIKCLKPNRSPGKDGVTAELIRNVTERGVDYLKNICNAIWTSGRWPDEWTESVFVPLHKKGSTKKCNNYRTIALISHASKIMLHIINKRLKHYLDCQIPQEQAGFVKGKGTREQILNVRQIIEKSREFNTPVILCFIDYAKAFDCVRWDKLWNILLEMGVPSHLVSLMRNLYSSNCSYVRIDSECSNAFQAKKGVRQGCILSPMLFNIYGEYIIRKCTEKWHSGFTIGGRKITNLRYADDTVLLAPNMLTMKEMLEALEAESEVLGLSVNRSKTKLMIVDRAGTLPDIDAVSGIDTVKEMVYLGASIKDNGDCCADIRRRIGMAKDAMTRLQGIWKDRGITKNTKIRLVRALVLPIFLYGAETWTVREAERKKIDAFEMWCWRRMLRIPWTAFRTNVSILKELGIKDRLSTICQRRILSYFGHIIRRQDENLEKLIICANVEGKRSRGRSPMRWSDQLKQESSSRFEEVVRMAADRTKWKTFTNRWVKKIGGRDLQS